MNEEQKLILKIRKWLVSKTFSTRGGIAFSKKMWRDGYNKALQDVENYLIMLDDSFMYQVDGTMSPEDH